MLCTSAGAVLPTDLGNSVNNLYKMYGSVLNILILVCQVTGFHRR